jgi:hypothetical protein
MVTNRAPESGVKGRPRSRAAPHKIGLVFPWVEGINSTCRCV